MHQWIPTTFEQACKRAAGRRRYHAERRRKRDERQLLVMDMLLRVNWQSYGIGRVLADELSVDAATISRDIRYIREWREHFIKAHRVSEIFADAVIRRLVAARIHPRLGYSWTYIFKGGVSTLRVRRGFKVHENCWNN